MITVNKMSRLFAHSIIFYVSKPHKYPFHWDKMLIQTSFNNEIYKDSSKCQRTKTTLLLKWCINIFNLLLELHKNRHMFYTKTSYVRRPPKYNIWFSLVLWFFSSYVAWFQLDIFRYPLLSIHPVFVKSIVQSVT